MQFLKVAEEILTSPQKRVKPAVELALADQRKLARHSF
jgi:hypothetical protein